MKKHCRGPCHVHAWAITHRLMRLDRSHATLSLISKNPTKMHSWSKPAKPPYPVARLVWVQAIKMRRLLTIPVHYRSYVQDTYLCSCLPSKAYQSIGASEIPERFSQSLSASDPRVVTKCCSDCSRSGRSIAWKAAAAASSSRATSRLAFARLMPASGFRESISASHAALAHCLTYERRGPRLPANVKTRPLPFRGLREGSLDTVGVLKEELTSRGVNSPLTAAQLLSRGILTFETGLTVRDEGNRIFM